jgi:hypothetical protein
MSGKSVAMKSSAYRALMAAEPGLWRRYALAFGFLLPALFLLGIWIVYPTVRTIVRSFFSDSGGRFVWFDNYKQLFTSDILRTAIKNNAIWVAVVPALVTAIGLIFAVLTERVSWSLAFKTAVSMPLAVSALPPASPGGLSTEDPDQNPQRRHPRCKGRGLGPGRPPRQSPPRLHSAETAAGRAQALVRPGRVVRSG